MQERSAPRKRRRVSPVNCENCHGQADPAERLAAATEAAAQVVRQCSVMIVCTGQGCRVLKKCPPGGSDALSRTA